ncbi:altered inheritance of mitochondria protein 21, partial [Massariosphaeria phaeospora]
MSAPPTIPPRPSRAQNESNPASSSHMDVPKIPPRPKRSIDRSISPNRDTFARSPLNDPAFLHDNQSRESGLGADLPPRPPSVSLPSIGQEGNEYASFDDLSKTLTNENAPEQTKNVAGDLPLYAPTASVPSSTAKSRIETVTRTDSQQAAAAGIGKLLPDDKSARGADSGRSASSAGGNTRPSSVYKEEEEQGIPEIGIQVPMYPNAGDVQAPTPSPFETAVPTGVGFFNKGGHTPGRHHGRTKSGREVFHGPPGSYGLHGHGVIPKDEFGQKWYAKHPEDLAREKAGEYGPHIQENRKEYHWHGEKLEKLVHDANAKGIGLGTSREAISTPDEQIGYLASEEFASRMASPKPQSGRPASITSKTANPAESPLRQTNFPAGQLTKQKTHESEPDEDVIHIDPPAHRMSKINGVGYEEPTEDLGPEGGNTGEEGGWVSERGYGIPILASDEIQKYPGAKFRQPAVSPELERRASGEYTVNEDGTPAYISKPRPHSRSSSRNNAAGQRYMASPSQHDRSGTPLESHKEYEPLFPEDEETVQKPKSAVDKLKRPDHLARHHFPSQDVWEDTPSSLQLETTVDTPQLPEEPETSGDVDASKIFEKPEQEEARKDNIPEEDQQSFLPEHTKRFANKRLSKDHLDLPNRPGMQQRFPSQDIWEDAPEHGHLETTVSGPQSEDTNEYAEDAPVAVKNATADKPTIPSRPQKAKEISPIDKKPPGIPDKPKPQLPARPVKPLIKSSDKVPTLQSEGSIDAAPQPKAKPAVPARPGGSKIAALQAGFMKDLNSKLGLGPPKVKEPEPEKEEEPPKPLQDARKGRAKGPQRRKPASSPTPAAAATVVAEVAVPRVKLELAPVTTLWSIGDDGVVDAPAASMAVKLQAQLQQPAKSELSEVAEQD